MAKYIQEISHKTISNIIEALRQFRYGEFKDVRNLTHAIAAILEHDIEGREFQESAVKHYGQIVNIIIDKTPRFLAIKKDVSGKLYFQVDEDIVNAH